METHTMTTPCPIARAEVSLTAIFAACQANKAALAKARQAKADKRLAGGRFWWREDNKTSLLDAKEKPLP